MKKDGVNMNAKNENNVKCPHCGRDMELIGLGSCSDIYECLKEDCGEGYEEVPNTNKS